MSRSGRICLMTLIRSLPDTASPASQWRRDGGPRRACGLALSGQRRIGKNLQPAGAHFPNHFQSPITGMLISVRMRSGLNPAFNLSRASWPLLAVSTWNHHRQSALEAHHHGDRIVDDQNGLCHMSLLFHRFQYGFQPCAAVQHSSARWLCSLGRHQHLQLAVCMWLQADRSTLAAVWSATTRAALRPLPRPLLPNRTRSS